MLRGAMPKKTILPPRAPCKPHPLRQHGETRNDPYYWLRNRQNPRVLQYLRAENRYTEQILRPTRPLRQQLVRELRSFIRETDCSVPARRGDYWYYRRTEKGKQYVRYCRKRGTLRALEETVLDVNRLARGQGYCTIGDLQISPDHRWLAYTIDTMGREVYTLRIVDLQQRGKMVEEIVKVSEAVEWANDSATLWYLRHDATQRAHQVWRHCVGAPVRTDVCVYTEHDARFVVGLQTTRSRAYCCIASENKDTSEVRVIPLDTPDTAPRVLLPRKPGHEYQVEHAGAHWYFRTNWRAKSFYVVRAPLADPRPAQWKTMVPPRAGIEVDDIDLFATHLVVTERVRGLPQLRALPLLRGRVQKFTTAEETCAVELGENPEFSTTTIRVVYSSLVTPRQIIDWNVATGAQRRRKQDTIRGYRSANYRCERVWIRSHDGVRVPMSIVCPKNFRCDGTAPVMLYGYGSYGHVVDDAFTPNWITLLRRGFAVAVAHVRGGGELGRAWYDAGKKLQKPNTFRDFCACAEWLVRHRWTSSQRLIARGASAGGLLMGAVANSHPELFAGIVAGVPFVDVVTTMSDPTIPLTTLEYDEWGNPAQPAFYRCIRRYSPYDNVRSQNYPAMLVTAGLHDPRVGYWEPAKWVAKLRTMKMDTNPLLLHTDLGSGHGGQSGRYARLPQQAMEYAFMIGVVNGALKSVPSERNRRLALLRNSQ